MWKAILICLLIFIFYTHWIEQYNFGDKIQLYELDYTTKTNLLENIKNLKQPIMFEFSYIINSFHKINTLSFFDILNLDNCIYEKQNENCGEFENEIEDDFEDNEYSKNNKKIKKEIIDEKLIINLREDKNSQIFIPFELQNVKLLFDANINNPKYYSEKNFDFVEQLDFVDSFHEYLSPDGSLLINKTVDIWFGQKTIKTQFRHHIDNLVYFYNPKNENNNTPIKLTLFPLFKNKHKNNIKTNYELFEFQWNQKIPQRKIEVELPNGFAIFIPPYWCYSIEYLNDNSFIYKIQYNSLMNIIAHGNFYCHYYFEKYIRPVKNISTLSPINLLSNIIQEKNEENIKSAENIKSTENIKSAENINVEIKTVENMNKEIICQEKNK